MIDHAYWIPLLPLLGTVAVGVLGPRVLRGRSHWPVILGVAGALAGSIWLFFAVRATEPTAFEATHVVYRWIATGDGDNPATPRCREDWFDVSFRIDPLTAVMLLTVCTVSLLVVIYSRDYMREQHGQPERGYSRFFAFLGLFVFSMCTLVLAGNFLLLYLGWEAVGLCSYLLIGFWYTKPSAAEAAKKAFIVNRIGDFGFGLGVLLIYLTFGTLDYHVVFAAAEAATRSDPAALAEAMGLAGPVAAVPVMATIQARITVIALLLFCGAVGKSAQIPLYVWLPDAMEGPTPVSALIHAATMVTAGVYMVARCGAIFAASPEAMLLVAVVGAVTALFSATIALAQYDMKRILAYSTISQLGYMFLGLGVYAAGAAIFHLYTHAFFKALLFLGAGSVMHAMGGIIDVRRFGGLCRRMPVTYVTFVIGALSLAGFPLLAGFWSKDEIIHAAMTRQPLLGVLALATAVLTAFYTFRMVYLAFHGPERLPKDVHPHESGRWMLFSLVLLSVGAVFAGYVGIHIRPGGFAGLFEPQGAFQRFLEPVLAPFRHGQAAGAEAAGHEPAGHALMYLSSVLAIAGIATAYILYVRRPDVPAAIVRAAPGAYRLLNNKYYVDELYDRLVVRPLRGLGRLFFAADNYVIDGILWFVTAVPQAAGFALRSLQRGALQGYALGMVVGLAVVLMLVLAGS